MKANVVITTPSYLNPMLDRPTQKGIIGQFRKLITIIFAIVSGEGVSRRQSDLGHEVTKIEYATDYAVASFTLATVVAASTVTLNGAAMTAVSGAVSGDQFDISGGNTTGARSFVNQLKASATAALAQHFDAACRRAIVTFAAAIANDWVQLGETQLFASNDSFDASAGGVRLATAPDTKFSLWGSNTNAAISFCNCVNLHPKLKERFYATQASGVVTIEERPPESVAAPIIFTSDGTRLAITGAVNVLADSPLVLVQSKEPGYAGNAKTIASSSGSTLAITGSATRLAGGIQASQSF